MRREPRSRSVCIRRWAMTSSVSSLDHAEQAVDRAVVVEDRAVGERVVRLLGVAAALQEQHQRLVPGGHAGRHHGARCGGRCRPRSPTRPPARAGRAPRGTSRRACRGGRRRCRRRSARGPRPSTSRTATSASAGRRTAGSSARSPAGPSGVASQSTASRSRPTSPLRRNISCTEPPRVGRDAARRARADPGPSLGRDRTGGDGVRRSFCVAPVRRLAAVASASTSSSTVRGSSSRSPYSSRSWPIR